MESPKNQPSPPILNVWALALNLGFMIAVPLVICVVIGVKLDNYFSTTPVFIILGMVLAMIISTVSIGRKIKHIKL